MEDFVVKWIRQGNGDKGGGDESKIKANFEVSKVNESFKDDLRGGSRRHTKVYRFAGSLTGKIRTDENFRIRSKI